jgi:oligoribonuclease (3'-5' exoribonuclease)
VLVSAWYPNIEFPRPATNHRALDDVRASLEELRFYCQHAFKVDLQKLAQPRRVVTR